MSVREKPLAAPRGRAARARSVVLAHPGRQNAYEAVLAAQERGLLQAFATGVYLQPVSRAHRLVELGSTLPLVRSLMRSGLDRSHPGIDSARVTSFPVYPLLARPLRRWPGGQRIEPWANRRCDASIARWLRRLEPPPALVQGWEGGARATLAAARSVGAATVLDVVCAHEYAEAALLAEGASIKPGRLDGRIRAERELADFLFAPSPVVVQCLVENGVPRDRIVEIPFGVDPARFAPGARTSGRFRALFVGFVGLRKGVRYLLEAWRRLDLPGAELVVIGDADAHGREILRDYQGTCRWLGKVPRFEVNRWFSRSDLFVFPSLAEGSALVTYEAMASGLPVVTTPESGSVVRDGIEGFVVSARDVTALAERILLLYENAGLGEELGRRARARIESGYTVEHYRERLGRAYEAILDGRAPEALVGEVRSPREMLRISLGGSLSHRFAREDVRKGVDL